MYEGLSPSLASAWRRPRDKWRAPAGVGGVFMASENYRYYCLDRFGQLHNAVWFGAQSDEEAIAAIRAKHPDALCEIWQGHRLVARLSPERRPRVAQVQPDGNRRKARASFPAVRARISGYFGAGTDWLQ